MRSPSRDNQKLPIAEEDVINQSQEGHGAPFRTKSALMFHYISLGF